MAWAQPIPHMRPISDLRTQLSEIEELAESTGEPIVLTRNGMPKLVVFDSNAYNERLERERHVQKLREADLEAKYRKETLTLADSRARIAQIAQTIKDNHA